MRKLTLLTTIVFSLTMMFASPSFAKWEWVSKNVDGDNFYVDFESIRKHGGYVYYWTLADYLKPNIFSIPTLSHKSYHQVECITARIKMLSLIFYEEPMGKGNSKSETSFTSGWEFFPPDSIPARLATKVCKYAK